MRLSMKNLNFVQSAKALGEQSAGSAHAIFLCLDARTVFVRHRNDFIRRHLVLFRRRRKVRWSSVAFRRGCHGQPNSFSCRIWLVTVEWNGSKYPWKKKWEECRRGARKRRPLRERSAGSPRWRQNGQSFYSCVVLIKHGWISPYNLLYTRFWAKFLGGCLRGHAYLSLWESLACFKHTCWAQFRRSF